MGKKAFLHNSQR